MKKKTLPPLENLGSLITYRVPGEDQDTCLGFLILHEGKAFDATWGQVPVTAEHAATHNQELSAALIKGLDENCQVGQHGTAFYFPESGVTTFIGETISKEVTVKRQTITFIRNGKTFRGRISAKHPAFNFKRIA